MKKAHILLFALACGFCLQAQHVYHISCADLGDSVKVSLSCRFDGQNAGAGYLLLSEACRIASSNLDGYVRVGDTLRLSHGISELEMVYGIPKTPFTTADGAVVFRREGNWYPHRNSELLNATVELDAPRDYVLCGKPAEGPSYSTGNAFEIHLIMLPKDKFVKTMKGGGCRPFCFYRSVSDTARREEAFYSEFVEAYSFFSGFFDDSLSHDPMNVVEISDPQFMMCQSLPGTIIFGSYFYEIYKMFPDCSWVPHEVAHQWWGNNLFFEHRDYALGESVNEYLKLLFLKHRKRGFDDQMALYEANMGAATERLAVGDIRDVRGMDESIAVYNEAPLRLWKAATECRKCKFDKSLAALYRTYGAAHGATIVTRQLFAKMLDSPMRENFDRWLTQK